MKAHFERDWPRAGYTLYLYVEYQNARVPVTLDDGKFIYDSKKTAQVGQEVPATLFIPDEFYEAIRMAMVGEAIDNDDTIADARRIRDRLLHMVETEWQSRQLEKH